MRDLPNLPTANPTPPSRTPLAGDLARRVTRRRNELGLTVEALASRAGIDPVYLSYFERSPDASLSPGTLRLIAVALDTTPIALLGGDVNLPTGPGRAGRHPVLEALTREQCDAHLAVGGIGRVIFLSDRGPVALPVNFEFTEGHIIFSTDGSKAAAIEMQLVGFEVDRVDDDLSEGWSVVITGRAHRIRDPAERRRLGSLDLETWAGGDRHSLVGIKPEELTGRVIVHQSSLEQD
jgi:nitroimidazol reductase NimA-like FMN-containing flavoprotein (pyridoxamine 5'-phosphate oxidase superfamily)